MLTPAPRAQRDRLLEQRAADAAPPVARRHHQPEVGDVAARRVDVPGEGEPADDRAAVLGDVHRRIGMTAAPPRR